MKRPIELVVAIALAFAPGCGDDEVSTAPAEDTADGGASDPDVTADEIDGDTSADAFNSDPDGSDIPDEPDVDPGELIALPAVDGRVPEEAVYPESCASRVEDTESPGEMRWVATILETGCLDIAEEGGPVFREGVLPYAVRAPLWSDGAPKSRYLALPPGGQIEFTADGAWVLPLGSQLIKNFLYGDRFLETRFLVHEEGGWIGATYRWNADQDEADLVTSYQTEELDGQLWQYFIDSDCQECHTRASGQVLGLRSEQFFVDSDMFGLGEVNQVAALNALGYFTEMLPDSVPVKPLTNYLDAEEPIGDRARAYLASNCGHCHQPGGSGFNSLDFRRSRTLAETNACNEPPEGTNLDLGPDARVILPGDPDLSILVGRMNRTDLDRMPPLAVEVVHDDAVEMMRDWIEQLENCDE